MIPAICKLNHRIASAYYFLDEEGPALRYFEKALKAQLKRSITQGRFERIPAFFNQFFAALVRFVSFYDLTKFCLNLRKGCPSFLRPFTEVLFKAGQGQTTVALVYVLLGIPSK